MQPQAKEDWGHLKLEEARKDPFTTGVREGLCPC